MRHQRRGGRRVYARDMRKGPTDAEAVMWAIVRNRSLARWKIRRQHPIGPFIADFYCARLRFVIELDGADHFTPEGQAYDEVRTSRLERAGLQVLRIENREVIANPVLTAEVVRTALEDRYEQLRTLAASQAPLPSKIT